MKRYKSFWAISVCIWAVTVYLGVGCQPRPENGLLVTLSERVDIGREYELLDLHGQRTSISRDLGVLGVPSCPAVWSPAGDRIAYLCVTERGGPSQICEVDTTTLTIQTYSLPKDGFSDSLAWSADGTSFLFRWGLGYPDPSELWQLDLATQQLEMLSQLPVGVGRVSWSPDRSRVAFVVRDNEQGPDILYVQTVDGMSRGSIYEYENFAEVVWSPDGRTIAFSICPGATGVCQLCWMSVEGVEGDEVVCLQGDGGNPVWSPDGKSIALSDSFSIRVVDVQTKAVETIIELDGRLACSLSWSPSGDYLAYGACYSWCEPNETCEIYVVSIDGKEHRRLTRNWVADVYPVWQPVSPSAD